MPVFVKQPAELEEDFIAAGIGAKPVPQKLLGFGNFAEPVPQPVGCNRVGLDAARIEIGGQFEPRQDFSFIAMLQVSVFDNFEVAAEPIYPIAGLAEEILLFFVLLVTGSPDCEI